MKVALKRRDDAPASLIGNGEYVPQLKSETWSMFKCPKCGGLTGLARKWHDVNYEGLVYPNVHCPHKPCDFSAVITLEGWVPEAKGSA